DWFKRLRLAKQGKTERYRHFAASPARQRPGEVGRRRCDAPDSRRGAPPPRGIAARARASDRSGEQASEVGGIVSWRSTPVTPGYSRASVGTDQRFGRDMQLDGLRIRVTREQHDAIRRLLAGHDLLLVGASDVRILHEPCAVSGPRERCD